MKKLSKIILVLLATTSSALVYADDPIGAVPNVFNSGEPADATKMNQNFDKLYQHVNSFEQYFSVDTASKSLTVGNVGTTLTTQHPVSTRGSAPIGSIIAISKSLSSSFINLQGQWAPCNGQILSDPGSPLNGRQIPNLNGGKLFLRGVQPGTSQAQSGVIKEDQMQAHSHVSLGHTHVGGLNNTQNFTTHKASTTSNSGTSTIFGAVASAVTKFGAPTALAGDPTVLHGDETRPKNMSVIWVIKIRP